MFFLKTKRMFIKKVILALTISTSFVFVATSSFAYEYFIPASSLDIHGEYQHDFTHIPQPGECYPSDPRTKDYHEHRGNWLYEVKVISCEYICLDKNYKEHYLKGTEKVRSFFGESGREFVCKGFGEDMKWVETPHHSDRWGYYTLGKTRPFKAKDSKMPELEDWFYQDFH